VTTQTYTCITIGLAIIRNKVTAVRMTYEKCI